MIIYLDGAEKAGKTSLIKLLKSEYLEAKSVSTIKQSGRANPDGFVYLQDLIRSATSSYIFVWDRGWISEVVYGQLLYAVDPNYGLRLFSQDEWLAEWFLSRLAVGRGGNFIISPSYPEQLAPRRDETDLPVDYRLEAERFHLYAENYGHNILYNDYFEETAHLNCLKVLRELYLNSHRFMPWDYIGPKSPDFVMVAPGLSVFGRQDYNFQLEYPFYDEYWMEVFRPFGKLAISRFGYTTACIVPKLGLNKAKFVTFDERSYQEVKLFTENVYLVSQDEVSPQFEKLSQRNISNKILEIITGG